MSHVVYEGSTLHFRYRIPHQHRRALGQSVFKMSLKTGNRRLANHLSERLLVAVQSFFNYACEPAMNKLSPSDLKSKLREYLEQCLYEDEGQRATPRLPLHPLCAGGPIKRKHEPSELEMFIDEVKAGLHQADYSFFITYVDRFIEQSGLEVENGSTEYYLIARGVYEMMFDLLNIKLCRAQIDIRGEREYLAKLPELPPTRVSPTELVEPVPTTANSSVKLSPILESVVEKYISDKMDTDWSQASVKDIPPQLSRFVELVGFGVRIDELSRDHMRRYRQCIEHLPSSRHRQKYSGKSDEELMGMTIPVEHQFSPKSLETRFTAVRSLLNWCEAEGLLVNATPLKSILKVSKQKAKVKTVPRRAFTIDELKALFENDDYRKGKFQCAAKFWAPIIALFSGARLEEICQLHLDDIRNIDGFTCFDINAEDDKDVKTDAGKRIVPVHPFLAEIGLLDRVDYLRANGEKHLFHRSTLSQAGGKLSTSISKSFTYFRRKWGVGGETDETSEVVFHSFRHNVITWGKLNRVDRRLVKEVVGHEEGEFSDVTGGYEGSEPVKVRFDEFIKKIDFDKVLDLDHLKGSMWITKK